ncbi:MAG: hypothetical protein AB7F43_12570 [Bacteriovoracia bacterium]
MKSILMVFFLFGAIPAFCGHVDIVDLSKLRARILTEALPEIEASVGPVEEVGFFLKSFESLNHLGPPINEVVFAVKTKTFIGKKSLIWVGLRMGTYGSTSLSQLRPTFERDEIKDFSYRSTTRFNVKFTSSPDKEPVAGLLKQLEQQFTGGTLKVSPVFGKWMAFRSNSFLTSMKILNFLQDAKVVDIFEFEGGFEGYPDGIKSPFYFLGTGKESLLIDLGQYAVKIDGKPFVLNAKCSQSLRKKETD